MKPETRWYMEDGTPVDWSVFNRSNKKVWQWRELGFELTGKRQNVDIWGVYPREQAALPEKERTWQLLRVIYFKTNGSGHKCDSRCLNAKGHDCECSCGGANHGANA